MMNEDRKQRIARLAAEQRARPARIEVDRTLGMIAEQNRPTYHWVPTPGSGQDVLANRFLHSTSRVVAVDSLEVAVSHALAFFSRVGSDHWLIRLGKLPRLGSLQFDGTPTAEILCSLLLWDGEGLLVGPGDGDGWMLLDVLAGEDGNYIEVSVSADGEPTLEQ